jgi:hypothetical protein
MAATLWKMPDCGDWKMRFQPAGVPAAAVPGATTPAARVSLDGQPAERDREVSTDLTVGCCGA